MEPYAHASGNSFTTNNGGDLSPGAQFVLYHGEGVKPTFAASYFYHAYDDGAPSLDIGSPKHTFELLASFDAKNFHFDINGFLTDLEQKPVRRAQFGHTISVSHPLAGKFALTAELWRFTQPYLHSNAVGSLWALTYSPSKILVFDVGFDRGLTGTSTRWQEFIGVTYLLPHRLWKPH